MKAFVVALCLVLAATSAQSATYQWTDKKGVVHYTDNFDRIPPEHQNRAREVTLDAPPVLKYEDQQAETISPPGPQPAGRERGERYCGRSGPQWQRTFSSLRQERRKLADSLPGIEEELLRRHNRLQRSLWDFDRNPPKKGDKKAEELAAARRAKQTASGQYGRPSVNRKEYQETLAERDGATKRIAEVDRELADLETEAARCGVPLQFRQ